MWYLLLTLFTAWFTPAAAELPTARSLRDGHSVPIDHYIKERTEEDARLWQHIKDKRLVFGRKATNMGTVFSDRNAAMKQHLEKDFGAHERTLTTVDGVRISALERRVPDAPLTLVCATGYLPNRIPGKEWVAPFYHLFSSYNIISFDWRNTGDSKKDSVSFDHHAEHDVRAALQYCKDDPELRNTKVVLMGFCFGGVLALEALATLAQDAPYLMPAALCLNGTPMVVNELISGTRLKGLISGSRTASIMTSMKPSRYLAGRFFYGKTLLEKRPIDRLAVLRIPICFQYCMTKDRVAPMNDCYRGYKAAIQSPFRYVIASEPAEHVRLHTATPHQYTHAMNQFLIKSGLLDSSHVVTPNQTPFVGTPVSNRRPEAEANYLAKRLRHVYAAQEKLLHRELPRPLRIGIAASGGGWRAMTATAGMLAGLEKIGVTDCVQSYAGLSGSTWAIMPWLVSNTTFDQYATDLAGRLGWGLIRNPRIQYRLATDAQAERSLHHLETNAMDIYGVALAHTLLRPETTDYHNLRLPATADMMKPEQHPFIMCTASTKFAGTDPYQWVTFTPYSICQINDRAYIPAHALSSRFENGMSVSTAPPLRLGYAMGMYGSAFSASFRDAYEKSKAVKSMAHKMFSDEKIEAFNKQDWSNSKLVAARVPNFTYQLAGAEGEHSDTLQLVDGGYLNNQPIEPLLDQHAEPFDLLIIMDSNKNAAARKNGMRRALSACEKRGYNLAPLDDTDMETNTVTISHGTPDQTSIIYVTLEPDSSFHPKFNVMKDRRYRTTNFFYNKKTATQIIQSLKHVITSRQDTILDAIARVAHDLEDDTASDAATVAIEELQEDQMLLEETAHPDQEMPTHSAPDAEHPQTALPALV